MGAGTSRAFERRDLLGACAAVAVACLVSRARAEERRYVSLVPLGRVSALEVVTVERALRAFYALDVRVSAAEVLPRTAYYAKRQRYRAERLLDHLEQVGDGSSWRVLGLASVDISTTKGKVFDWGVLGLATIDGRACVLSSFRCRRGAHDSEGVAHRLGKTAVHELGHTFGLDHCPNFGCLMEDGKGSVLTTDHEYDLCASCRAKLGARKLLADPAREPPWPRPA